MTSKGNMIHGHVTDLKKVSIDDAPDIINLRNNPQINRYLSSTAEITLDQQVGWMKNNAQKEDNYYWKIVSKDEKTVGTISLYEIKNGRAEFGRYICLNPINAIESEYMLLQFAFNEAGLEQVYCRTVVENTKVWKQHTRFGFEDTGIENNKELNQVLKVQQITRQQFNNYDYSALINIFKRFK